MTATWLADALRKGGCAVNETVVPDWKTRGHTDGPAGPYVGVVGHHTAGGATGDLPSLTIVRDGRPDLAGPLANLMLSRSGVWVPIAAGRCWHAGAADNAAHFPWVPRGDANGYLLGIEAESAGTGDWTPAQLAAYPRGVAVLLSAMGVGADRFIGHLEWAPSRKIDPAGWPGGMAGFRASVTKPTPAPVPEDDMTPAQAAQLTAILDLLTPGKVGVKFDGDIYRKLTNASAGVATLLGRSTDIDPSKLASAIVDSMPDDLARQVADELGKRLNSPT